MKKQTKYIFVAGGVMSGVGKGITTASIGKILQAQGLAVSAMKIDPYVNVDAGTMNPTEHGEVFVLDDGTECDQDMGNYERFLGRSLDRWNYMTTGSVYLSVIQKERNLEYKGRCVEVVPHIPLEVIAKIEYAAEKDKADVMLVEIGGTVGEYQNILFLEAVRILKLKKPDEVLLVLVSFLPHRGEDNEPKTKPTQYAVRTLNSVGLQPDMVIARAATAIDKKRKEKIAFNCGIQEEYIVSAPDVQSIYEVPVCFERDKLSKTLLKKLKMKSAQQNMEEWKQLVGRIRHVDKKIKIGIVGKYFTSGNFALADSYISVLEAVKHAAYHLNVSPLIEWLPSEQFEEKKSSSTKLKKYAGIIVPGGFGGRGVEGKIQAIKFCRENKIPYLGLCYGMQLMIVEYARHVAHLKNAHTTEINPRTPHPVIDVMKEQKDLIAKKHYGGTMRLGAYPALVKPGTIAYAAYSAAHIAQRKAERKNDSRYALRALHISERHRHRYEVNPDYITRLEAAGLVFSGQSPDGTLMESAELPARKHPFFVGTQFHPEFLSRPLAPHPLFSAFLKISKEHR